MRTLYIAENCHQCSEVSGWVKENSPKTLISNVDQAGEMPPISIFIFPALFEGDGLIAYGEDIIPFLRSVNDRTV